MNDVSMECVEKTFDRLNACHSALWNAPLLFPTRHHLSLVTLFAVHAKDLHTR